MDRVTPCVPPVPPVPGDTSGPAPAPVLRAPLRSRDDAVDHAAAVAWAVTGGWCGTGERGGPADRVRARLARFADPALTPDGSFVWTRHPGAAPGDGYRLGRLAGPVRIVPDGTVHDLRLVRPCTWLPEVLVDDEVPLAVRHTFARRGRNLQHIRPATTPGDIASDTLAVWRGLRDSPL